MAKRLRKGLRRGTWALSAVVLAVTACGGPDGDHQVAGPTTPATTPAVTASPTPTGPPTGPPTRGPEVRLSLKQLGESTLDLGPWTTTNTVRCPDRNVKFHSGKASANGYDVRLTKVAYADVDRDGTVETLALFACDGVRQVVAYDQRGTATAPGFLGQVYSDWADQTYIADLKAGPDGAVSLRIGDYDPGDYPAQIVQYQWRDYGLTITGVTVNFIRNGGPTEFPPNRYAADISVSATAAKSGSAYTVTVTISNASTVTAPYVWVFVGGGSATRFRSVGSGLSRCVNGTTRDYVWGEWCHAPTVPAKGSITVTMAVGTVSGSDRRVQVLIGQFLTTWGHNGLPDSGTSNLDTFAEPINLA